MDDLIKEIPSILTNLPSWAIVLILIILCVAIVLIVKFTSNNKSNKISHINQTGFNNEQKIANKINEFKN